MSQIENFTSNLNSFAVIEIAGNDATAFLQAQLTSDITTIKTDDAQFSSWCTPQGRIITTMLVYKNKNSYYILLPKALKDDFQKKISIYILRSKVTITSRDNLTHITGISGKEFIQEIKNHLTKEKYTDALFIEIPDQDSNRIILATKESLLEKIPKIDANINDAYIEHWKDLDIQSGMVWITEQTSNKLLPQDIDLEKLNALSHNKGCYPGQEIIARLHFRGKAKYGLYKGNFSSDQELPTIGERLYLPDDSASCGMIVSVAKNNVDGNNCLASLKHDKSDVTHYALEDKRTIDIKFSNINDN